MSPKRATPGLARPLGMNSVTSGVERFQVCDRRNVQLLSHICHAEADWGENSLNGCAVTVGNRFEDGGDIHRPRRTRVPMRPAEMVEHLDGGLGADGNGRDRLFLTPATPRLLLFSTGGKIFHDEAHDRLVGKPGAVQPLCRRICIPQLDDCQQEHRRIDDLQLQFIDCQGKGTFVHLLDAGWKPRDDFQNVLWHCCQLSVVFWVHCRNTLSVFRIYWYKL